jgi:hypothetical protein
MLISEMEAVLRSLDQRVGRIEQILPTLATKAELRDEIRGVRVLVEDVRGDVKVVHDRIDIEMAGLNRRMDEKFDAMQGQFDAMQGQFDRMQAQFDVMQMRFDEVLRRLPPR